MTNTDKINTSPENKFNDFVEKVLKNLHKNGFPEKKVAFPLEKMYEAADDTDISFNKVLDTLKAQGIDHIKTPEKIIFSKHAEPAYSGMPGLDGINPDMFSNLNPDMLKGFNPDMLKGINLDMFKGMDMSKLMSMASEMMKNMTPEQMEAVKKQYENMSDEERREMLENAKNSGLL
jgi:hypothetical protein